ncbi:MAG: hypothetical protein R6V58_16750 [Planctomycetota bacterium]
MRLILAAVALLAGMFSLGARADTLFLRDDSKIEGEIGKLTLDVRGKPQEVARDEIKMGVRKDGQWQILTKKGQLHVGTLQSVTVVSLTGDKTFSGARIAAIHIEKPKPEPPSPGADAGVLGLPDKEPEKKELTEDEKAELRRLARACTKLRDKYIQKAKDIASAQHEKLRDKYVAKVEVLRGRLEKKKDLLAKHIDEIETTGPEITGSNLGVGFSKSTTITKSPAAAIALDEYKTAKTKYDRVVGKVKAIKAVIVQQARFRIKRINAYHDAILKHLRAGQVVPEDVMTDIFDKALGVETDDDDDDDDD